MKNKTIWYIAIVLLTFKVDAVNFFGSSASDRKSGVTTWFLQHKKTTAFGGITGILLIYHFGKPCYKQHQIIKIVKDVGGKVAFDFIFHRLIVYKKGNEGKESGIHETCRSMSDSNDTSKFFNKYLTNKKNLLDHLCDWDNSGGVCEHGCTSVQSYVKSHADEILTAMAPYTIVVEGDSNNKSLADQKKFAKFVAACVFCIKKNHLSIKKAEKEELDGLIEQCKGNNNIFDISVETLKQNKKCSLRGLVISESDDFLKKNASTTYGIEFIRALRTVVGKYIAKNNIK